jgi:hypothetical protein
MFIAALTGRGLAVNLRDYIWFWPGVVVAVIVAAAASGWLGRVLRLPRAVAFGLVFSLGLIAAATLTPSREALLFGIPGPGTCDLSGFLPSLGDLRSFNDTSLNVFLYIPLGFTVGIAAATRRTLVPVLVSVALPFALPPVIEGIQLVATPLGRSCQSVDVGNNLTGLVAGLTVAAIAAVGGRLLGAPWWGPGDVSDPGS